MKVDKHILRYERKWQREHQIVRREGNPSKRTAEEGGEEPFCIHGFRWTANVRKKKVTFGDLGLAPSPGCVHSATRFPQQGGGTVFKLTPSAGGPGPNRISVALATGTMGKGHTAA